MEEPYKKWTDFYQYKSKEDFPRWPIEHIVKLFFGDYLTNKINIPKNASILDVGCGFGNNLLPFLLKGLTCYGTEVTEEISKIAEAVLYDRGFKVTIKIGSNRKLPFEDGLFDIVISSGVIHYEGRKEQIEEALREYSRVLKPKGVLFISTTGPAHDLFKKAKKVGPHRYQIQDYDFRNSQVFFFFENEKYLQNILKPYFKIVETGQVQERLMKRMIDTLIAVCQIKSHKETRNENIRI